ncbi:sodium:calcium antiporter [Alkalibacterium olivapovliticus]|uniref:Cation:H+ antiporter n=1 Tax=Alkalibacterium olivapovliticus TaxID=99907 RepID=A0A2T0VY69_9LACT|nr:sodium:calcium antiporter [Alkalibacterium olivapovliticus]PRY77142.1 cation:H+ antiporter [Alkalibacterium olivapovliticus]
MTDFINQFPVSVVTIIFIVSLVILSKSADKLIDKAVALSLHFGLSKVVVGATILSVGTTLPEVSSSVVAAIGGNGQFGLGNAIGSMITNASLILGIGAVVGIIPVKKELKDTFLLLCGLSAVFIGVGILAGFNSSGGNLPGWSGIGLLVLLPMYLWYTVKKKPQTVVGELQEETGETENESAKPVNIIRSVGILVVSSLGVTAGATLLVAAAEVGALRLGIPDTVISSTLVAFGTSVPEVTTTLVAVRYGHGELAIGNVLGANMMNLLLVMGSTITLIPGGISVPSSYYYIQFPFLILILILLSIPVLSERVETINRKNGFLLIGVYVFYLFTNFI